MAGVLPVRVASFVGRVRERGEVAPSIGERLFTSPNTVERHLLRSERNYGRFVPDRVMFPCTRSTNLAPERHVHREQESET